MDMITIDVSGGNIQIGDMVTLWGEGLSADEIARQCGTISYELFCQITSRVKMHYLGDDDTPAEELKRNVEFERG
jgi:alanine racemase